MEKKRQTETERTSIHWFTCQIAATTKTLRGQMRSQNCIWISHVGAGGQALWTVLRCFSQVYYQGAGSEGEPPGHKPALNMPCWSPKQWLNLLCQNTVSYMFLKTKTLSHRRWLMSAQRQSILLWVLGSGRAAGSFIFISLCDFVLKQPSALSSESHLPW